MKRPLPLGLLAGLLLSGIAQAANYGLFVGLNEYLPAYIASDNWLRFCVSDAGAMRTNLISHGGGWTPARCTNLLNAAATRSSIRAALSNLAAQTTSGDIVVYFHSSHGGNVDLSQPHVYLCAYDADYDEADLAADLAAFPAGVKIIVIVDACHSEGLFLNAPANLSDPAPHAPPPRDWDLAGRVTSRMAALRAARSPSVASRLLAPEDIGWMTACAFNEYSYEDDEVSHGWFTWRLLQGFTYGDTSGDGWASFQELFDHAALRIPHVDQTPRDLHPAILATPAGTAGPLPAGDAWDYADNVPLDATPLSPSPSFQTHGPHSLRNDLDESDFFAFPVRKNRLYTLRSRDLSGDVDAYLYTVSDAEGPRLIRYAYDINGAANRNFEMVFKPVDSGTAFLQVQSYPRTNNATYTLEFANLGSADSMPTLSNGVPRAIPSIPLQEYKDFRIPVPAGQTNLSIRLSGGTGDSDLYVARGYIPWSDQDYLSDNVGNSETITVTNPPPGDWFIEVYAYAASSNLTLSATCSPGAATIAAASHTPTNATFAVDLTNGARVSIYAATNFLPASNRWAWSLRSTAVVANGSVSAPLDPTAPRQLLSVGRPLAF